MRVPVTGAAALAAFCAAAFLPSPGNAAPPGPEAPSPQAARARMIAEAEAAARPGDIVFKKGGGVWGVLAARFSENDEGFGHVGMVDRGPDGALIVIHAGGDPFARHGHVQTVGFAQFLRAADAAALYRPEIPDDAARQSIDYAEDAARRNTPFDTAFSLDTEDELYCTELIWRALSAALGEDAVPEKSERSGKIYVAIDDLEESPFVRLAWRSPVNAASPSTRP